MPKPVTRFLVLLLLGTTAGFVPLAGSGILHGFVTDSSGQPVTTLTAVVTQLSGPASFSATQAVSATGEFVIDPPIGDYLVELQDTAGQVVDYRTGVNIFNDITTFLFFKVDLPTHCQQNLGFGAPGGMTLTLCGDDLTSANSSASLAIHNVTPNSVVFLPIGLTADPTPFGGGTLVPLPLLTVVTLSTDNDFTLELPVSGGGATPVTFFMQVLDPTGPGFRFSNAIEAVIGI